MMLAIKHSKQKIVLAALVAMGFFCGSPEQGWSGDEKLLGYVVLAEQGHALKGNIVPIVRLILDKNKFSDESCEALSMTNGIDPPINKHKMLARPRSKANKMPIIVCEAEFPFSKEYKVEGTTWTVTDASTKKEFKVELPTVSRSPETALVFGDSGCRNDKKQECTPKAWPLPDLLVTEMAKRVKERNKPAVIIHVGDYTHRGKKTDTNDSNQKWNNWHDHFFKPMADAKLLAMAPLVAARGNHELCHEMGNNGDSWFYLLDPTSLLADDSEQLIKEHNCNDKKFWDILTRPYRLDFDNGLTLIVTDTANLYDEIQVNDAYLSLLNGWYQEMIQNFIACPGANKRMAWMVTHVPIWSVLGICCKTKKHNPTQLATLETLKDQALPEQFKVVLSGHKHLYTSVDVNQNNPTRRMLQLVTGNGGGYLNPNAFMGCVDYENTKQFSAFHATVHGTSHFGFVVADLKKDDSIGMSVNFNSIILKNGLFKNAEVCKSPAEQGKDACKINDEEKIFSRSCKSTVKVDVPKLSSACKPDHEDDDDVAD
ncbi:MAG: metallophosphoesterase [Magnetococcus sp. YQC-5]